MIVSIVIPYVRPQNMDKLLTMIKLCAGIPDRDYEILAEEDTKRIGCPKMVKKLVKKSKGDNVCFLGDDTVPKFGFLKYALEDMQDIEWGLIGLNDRTGRTLPTHWLASKKLLPGLGGEFFHTGYTHVCCDVELMERCIQMNRYRYSQRAVVLHDHPLLRGEPLNDPDYERVYDIPVRLKDQNLLKQRRANNWHTNNSKISSDT